MKWLNIMPSRQRVRQVLESQTGEPGTNSGRKTLFYHQGPLESPWCVGNCIENGVVLRRKYCWEFFQG